MAHNAYLAGRGSVANWGIGTTVSPTECFYFESGIYKSINGDDGGTWAPSSLITIGGLGLRVSGPFTTTSTAVLASLQVSSTISCTGSFTSYGNVVLDGGTLTMVGSASMGPVSCSTLTATGNVALGNNTTADTTTLTCITQQAGWLNCQASVSIGTSAADTLEVNAAEVHYSEESHSGAETHSGVETHSGNETHAGIVAISGTTAVSGPFQLSSPITMNTGAQVPRRTLWVINATATVLCNTYDEVVVSGLTSDSNVIYLSTTGAIENSHMTVVNLTPATYLIGVAQSGGFSTTVEAMRLAVFVFHSGAWQRKYTVALV